MSCNCKNSNTGEILKNESPNKLTKPTSGLEYVLKVTLFLFSLIFVPLFIPIMVWILFKTIVLNKNIDVLPILLEIGKRLKTDKYKEEEEDDEEDYEYETSDIEEFQPIKTN